MRWLSQEQSQIFDVVAAMLHLGNVDFNLDATVAHGDDTARVTDAAPLHQAASLLQVARW